MTAFDDNAAGENTPLRRVQYAIEGAALADQADEQDAVVRWRERAVGVALGPKASPEAAELANLRALTPLLEAPGIDEARRQRALEKYRAKVVEHRDITARLKTGTGA